MRWSRRVVGAGENRPLIFRFSQWKQQDFRAELADKPEELGAILGALVDAGIDIFDASVRYFNMPAFVGSDLSLATWAKKLTGKFASAVGGIGFSKGMYDALSNVATEGPNGLYLVTQRFDVDEFGLVSVGRALLHHPAWPDRAPRGAPLSPFDVDSLECLT